MAAVAPAIDERGAARPASEPLVSVIVPVRNRNEYLRTLLAALSQQTIPRDRFEIVIGDDGSTDGSTDDLATDDGWIRVMHGPPRNSYAARNRAAGAARAPVLAFCDSDCKPEPAWLEKGLAALEHCDAAAGQIRFILPARHTVWTLLDVEATKDHEKQVPAGNAETANLFVSRELFDRLGGFDDTLAEHGDFDFASRIVASGGRLAYAPEALLWHPTRDRARPFLRMLWIMNRWYAARARRQGERPVALKLRCWLPFVSAARGRRRYGGSIRLDRPRLRQNGLEPSVRDEAYAFVLNYFFIPYVRGAAQLRGWWDGGRLG